MAATAIDLPTLQQAVYQRHREWILLNGWKTIRDLLNEFPSDEQAQALMRRAGGLYRLHYLAEDAERLTA